MEMSVADIVFLLGAGLLGGGVNAIAGGGTFFTFPAFLAMGVPPLVANASNMVALYPGYIVSTLPYRHALQAEGRSLVIRCFIAACGGLLGALLLLWAGNKTFTVLVPYLLLLATLIFAAGPKIRALAQNTRLTSPLAAGMIEFTFALYGGYFGAGLGILLLAALTVIGISDLHKANGQKNLLSALLTSFSVAIFIPAGIIAWPETLVVLVGAVCGGYGGARLAPYIPAAILRLAVIVVGLVLSVYYFIYGA